MRILHSHGIPAASLNYVFRATLVAWIQYAAPSWSGMCSAADLTRLESALRRSKRLGYYSHDLPSVRRRYVQCRR